MPLINVHFKKDVSQVDMKIKIAFVSSGVIEVDHFVPILHADQLNQYCNYINVMIGNQILLQKQSYIHSDLITFLSLQCYIIVLIMKLLTINFIKMSLQSLALRRRAQSTISLRKRLIRMNSEEKPTELKPSATAISFRPKFQRMIQEGKIELIMNQDPSSKAHLFYTNHVSEMEKELASTKKSLSTLVIKSRSKEQSINTIKYDIKKVERQMEIIRSQAEAASRKYGFTNEQLQAKRNEKQMIYWSEKMFANMKSNRYKDQVFLKGRYEGLQKQFDLERDNHKLLEKKYHELKQLNRELKVFCNEARQIARGQSLEQREYIELRDQEMSERKLLDNLKESKLKRQGQINQIASSLIEREQLLKILEVLYSHRILAQIIKVKSNNLIKRYQTVNSAYNYIKSNSNIVEPQKILKRMEQHDKLYDDAVKRVNGLQQQLQNLEASLKNCKDTKNTILSQQGSSENIPKDYYQGRQYDKYELLRSQKQKLLQGKSGDQVLRKNILNWGNRMFARFGIAMSESNNFLDCLTDLVVKIRQQK